jgi:two-component system, LuxR family, sensor histidine kinase TtrS
MVVGQYPRIGCLLSIAVAVLLVSTVEAAEVYRIGVLAFRGDAHAMRSWQPTARVLSEKIENASFKVIPLPLSELRQSVADNRVDFVFTNSGQYVVLESEYGISRIATLKSPFGSEIRNVFGSVIFTRADRQDIQTLDDLRGKTFAAVKRRAFGGFQIAWREFKATGINPFNDFERIEFLGLPQDNIVFAVRDGKVDAGTVRTDVLETMASEDAIKLQNFRVLNVQSVPGHDVLLSTRLYPEWPFASMPKTPSELSEKVAIALLSLSPDSPPVLAAGYSGWTVPLDYKPVHDMFRELEIAPYTPGEIGFIDFLKQYKQWVVFACSLLVLIGLHGVRTEYLVKRRTKQLSEVNQELKHEISERHRAEKRARQHESELAHVSRVSVIGEMTSGLAHELRQPLAAINNYAEGGLNRLKRQNGNTEDISEALKMISEQSNRAGQIISHVRGYMQKREPKHEPIGLNHAINEAAALIREDAKAHNVQLHLVLSSELPNISGDFIEIEQLVINLARNAIDAMSSEAVESRILTITTERCIDGARVEVLDTGPGINDHDPEAMWEPFYSRKPGGLGLGLAICRTIIEMHGGRIWAESRPPLGAAFIFELPVLEEPNND